MKEENENEMRLASFVLQIYLDNKTYISNNESC